ncbi:maleylpyruvate isomerase N-terminal domain-containing protein [Dactylosporangium maewongense]|uniref:Maleylpyruvate isomerase N-terminal domain-containing protein n=1 Tax=Dactylosporangium maewongense TaxID=634393 RepID=A0ABP4MBN6_9ACTN
MTIEDRLTTLDTLWSVWAEHGRAFTDEQWCRPTRLGTWDVRSLYAHAGSWPFAFTSLVDRVRDAEPTHPTAAALLRDFNTPDGVANRGRDRTAAGAREDAATYSTAQMIEQFASAGPRAIATARQLGPIAVDYFGYAILRLDEAVSIGIMEATVHLLDLQRALGQPPNVPPDGLAHTTELLAGMAPPVDFIEAATGRSSVQLFPVLT